MICVIFTSKLEIPEDGNDVLDDVLDAKQFWHNVYALSIGDFNLLIRLVIQIIYISWNRYIKRKIIIFNYTKFWFYVQIKHLIKDQCTDQAQKAKRVLSAVSLIFVISVYFFYLSMFQWVIIHWSLSTVQFRSCSCHNPTCMYVQSQSKFWVASKLAIVIGSRGQILSWIEVWHVWNWQLFHCRWPNCWLQHILTWLIVCVCYVCVLLFRC